jgi:AbrB family looped-hinge helix DNA binding protein
MQTTRLSSKGQVVLPKAIREAHGWVPGTELLIEDGPNGVLLRPCTRPAPSSLEAVAGCLRDVAGPARTAEEMDAAIDTELRRRHDRGRY